MAQPESPDYQSDIFATSYPETHAFWEAAERDELLLKTCQDCCQPHWYPRLVCPHCASDNTAWVLASGRATIYSYSYVERADPPYILAYVTLEEGPTLITNIVDSDRQDLAINAPVVAVFKRTDQGRKMPFFKILTP